MARFRAFNSDTESSSSDSEDGECSSSDPGLPVVRVSHFTSQSPPPTTRADPSIIPWAQHIGIDAQKMHVMQTSLFRAPEEAAVLKALNQPAKLRFVVSQSLSRKHSRDSDGGGLRIESRERASFAHNIAPAPYHPSHKFARVESSTSIVAGGEGVVVDAGLALGRSFRVGWGPGSTLVHLGELCSPSVVPKISANSSIITKTTVPIYPPPGTSEAALASKLLQHHLSNSPIESDEDGVPFANPSAQLDFFSFSSLFSSTDRSYEATLFRLGHALFDKIDLHLGHSVGTDVRNKVYVLRRRAALSAWLESTSAPAVESDLKENPSAKSAAVAFTLLTGNQVQKACETAMDGGNSKLATLISQAGGDIEFREDLRAQLELWREQKIDVHVDESIRKVYALLAGLVDTTVEGSKGSSLESCADVNVVEGLDWKRVFGLHMWFYAPVDASIAQIFDAYNSLIKDSSHSQFVGAPFPWYKEHPPSRLHWSLPSKLPNDSLFSLIRLYAVPSCSLSHVLAPLSFSPSPMDYTLPWHLYIILSRCMRARDFADRGDPGLDVYTDSEGEPDDGKVEGHSPTADLLAGTYAFQLERMGMVQEALFVLLHIEGSAGREKAVKDMLCRSARLLDEWMTRGVVGSLKIPMNWVNEAKAIYALSNGELYKAYELYLAAGLYDSAHDLAVLELAPDAIIRQDLELLHDLFAKFVGHPVDGWHIRGKAFLDYVHIMTRLPELRDLGEVPDAAQALEVDELTRNVPRLIGILPDVLRDRNNPRHNAALAEMIAGLVTCVDQVRPLALAQSHVQPGVVDGATKLRHIHSTAYDRFLQTMS